MRKLFLKLRRVLPQGGKLFNKSSKGLKAWWSRNKSTVISSTVSAATGTLVGAAVSSVLTGATDLESNSPEDSRSEFGRMTSLGVEDSDRDYRRIKASLERLRSNWPSSDVKDLKATNAQQAAVELSFALASFFSAIEEDETRELSLYALKLAASCEMVTVYPSSYDDPRSLRDDVHATLEAHGSYFDDAIYDISILAQNSRLERQSE